MSKRAIEEDFAFYAGCMGAVMGKSVDELLGRRTFELFMCRAMIARSLHDEGWSFNSIGKTMRRNHSTISYGIARLNVALTIRGYDDIVAIWKAYQGEVSRGTPVTPEPEDV